MSNKDLFGHFISLMPRHFPTYRTPLAPYTQALPDKQHPQLFSIF
jgi:hypothetical protein